MAASTTLILVPASKEEAIAPVGGCLDDRIAHLPSTEVRQFHQQTTFSKTTHTHTGASSFLFQVGGTFMDQPRPQRRGLLTGTTPPLCVLAGKEWQSLRK